MNPTFDLLTFLIPAAAVMLALPFGLRARSEERSIRVVYLFHRNGDALVTVASETALPLEPSQLEPVLGAVRDFVANEDGSNRRFVPTSQRFGDEGVIGVRGDHVSACAVVRGRGDAMLRRDLARFVRDFELRNEDRLGCWEDATSLAGEASLEMTDLIEGHGPSAAAGFAFTGAAS